jgi:hypothetical protein
MRYISAALHALMKIEAHHAAIFRAYPRPTSLEIGFIHRPIALCLEACASPTLSPSAQSSLFCRISKREKHFTALGPPTPRRVARAVNINQRWVRNEIQPVPRRKRLPTRHSLGVLLCLGLLFFSVATSRGRYLLLNRIASTLTNRSLSLRTFRRRAGPHW